MQSIKKEKEKRARGGNDEQQTEEDVCRRQLPDTNLHFSKQCFEIWNKAIILSSVAKGGDGRFWINNKNVYRLIEVAVCDYYVEDFFDEMFNGLISSDFMVIYLQLLEYLLFEKRQRPPINYDDPNLDFKSFALRSIFEIVPSK